MKKLYSRLAYTLLLALIFTTGFSVTRVQAQYNAYVSYNDFYQDLASYGQWINDPQYGYVWSPNVDAGFRPYYTNGHWAMTDYGNTWVSGYSWGWACFHYGRWTYDNYYGWLWIPGSDWGPAWVSWRYGDGYFGWAPLDPGFDLGANSDYSCPDDWWVFIPPQYLYTGNYYHYWYGPHGNSDIIGNTTYINDNYTNNSITYVSGPRTKDVEDITHQPVQVFHIKNSNNLNTRVHNTDIKMFRPARINPAVAANGQRTAPPNVVGAPEPIRTPQAINAGQATPPQFRSELPVHEATPGTNINEVAVPERPAPRYDNNPYQWNVNTPIQQPRQNQEAVPQRQQPQQNYYRPQPAQQQPRQMPSPPQRQAPQPRQAPAPSRPAGRR